jgi:hypothetical protein
MNTLAKLINKCNKPHPTVKTWYFVPLGQLQEIDAALLLLGCYHAKPINTGYWKRTLTPMGISILESGRPNRHEDTLHYFINRKLALEVVNKGEGI